MDKNLLNQKLKNFGQEHLLTFYDDLTDEERKSLIDQLEKIDFEFMNSLYINSYKDEVLDVSNVSGLRCISKMSDDEEQNYKKAGEKIVNAGSYAIVILAGGNGSRLGFAGPKGCLELTVGGKSFSLFELFVGQVKDYAEKTGVFIDLFFMTSKRNNEKIVDFFKKKDHFGYPEDHIHFFMQDELPIMDVNGKLLLESKSKVLFGPNGNGNVFASLEDSGMLDLMQKKRIKYILFTSVDDVLNDLIDMSFIGAVVENNYVLGSKTLFKEEAKSKDWVFCKYDGKPFILPSKYISDELSNEKDDEGEYVYREKNVLYHLIDINSLSSFACLSMPYHRAYKKSSYTDLDGNFIVPNSPNSFKFEQFIFDSFYHVNDMLLYRISKEEFCPIKSKDDVEKAQAVLERKQKNL